MAVRDSPFPLASIEEESIELVTYKVPTIDFHVHVYNANSYSKHKCSTINDFLSIIRHNDGIKCVWVDVVGSMKERYKIVRELTFHFGVHELTLEDIQTVGERMKLDIFDDGIFLMMKMLFIDQQHDINIQQQQISFYLKENLLITFQEMHTPFFSPIQHRLTNNRGRLTQLKSDYLFYSLLDIVVEQYMIVLDRIGLNIAQIDSELMKTKFFKFETLTFISEMQHDMLDFRMMCVPLKDMIVKLQTARDRVPGRDSFAVQRRGLKPLRGKRGRRTNRTSPVTKMQSTQSRTHSLPPSQPNICQSRKVRAQSLSPTRICRSNREKWRSYRADGEKTILHEYIFMYFNDLHNHVEQMNGTIETYSEMISSLINFYISRNGNAVNQTVKWLTMINAVFHPMMLIHGLNSMNFQSVPQRDDFKNSYFIFLGIYLLILLIMLTWFTIKKWY